MVDWLLDKIPMWIWVVAAVIAVIVAWRLLGLRGLIATAIAAAGVLIYRTGRKEGADDARAKQVELDRKAEQERLEMHREASEIEKDAKDLSHEEAKKEALQWAKRQH